MFEKIYCKLSMYTNFILDIINARALKLQVTSVF